MQPNWWNWSEAMAVLVALLLMATCVSAVRAGAQQGKTDPPKPLPEKIVTAWKEAGAEVGWLRVTQDVSHQFVTQAGKPGDVPAFRFRVWQAGRLAKLPAPATAFGLYLRGTGVTDTGLKELAGLKSLHMLHLSRTQVTDAGLKELAGLKRLHMLYLGRASR